MIKGYSFLNGVSEFLALWSGNGWKCLVCVGIVSYFFYCISFHLFLALGGYNKVYGKVLACLMTVTVIDEMSMVTTDWPVYAWAGNWEGLSCLWLPYTCHLRVLSFSSCTLPALILSLCTTGDDWYGLLGPLFSHEVSCLGPGSEVMFSCTGLTKISDALKGSGAGLLCLHGRLLCFCLWSCCFKRCMVSYFLIKLLSKG